jgi:RNA polymerase sigma-70 factor (sigma-E family)
MSRGAQMHWSAAIRSCSSSDREIHLLEPGLGAAGEVGNGAEFRCRRQPACYPRRIKGVPDSESFDAFYRASRQRLDDCLFALTGNAAEAQDVVHEAYARAWQRWGTVGEYGNPEAWVRTVARRIAVSRWRRARGAVLAHRRAGPSPPVPGPGPETVALVAALAQLPVSQRVAIVLHHLLGLPLTEVAVETGVPVGTVKARLSRGRRALAQLLAVDLAEEESHV